jgi:hypothetical protein
MSIDLFGIIWFFVCAVSMFGNIRYISSVLIFSAIFQTSTAISFGSLEFSPFLVAELFFLVKAIPLFLFSAKKIIIPKWGKWLLWFSLYAIIATVLNPYFFEGIKVLTPSLGIDDSVIRGGSRLVFSNSNIAQIVLLVINVLTVYFVYLNRKKIEFSFLFNSFIISIYIILLLGFWRYASVYLHIPFPTIFFDNNQGHAILASAIVENRVRFTANFLEASSAGQFLSALVISLLLLKSKRYYTLMILALLGLILTLSGAGYVGLIMGFIIWGIRSNYKQLIRILAVGLLIVLVLYVSNYLDLFYNILITKSGTDSGINRSASNFFSWKICLDTYMFGAGLGSSRCSSFLFNLLATVGLLGTMLYYLFLIQPLRILYQYRKEDRRIDFIFMFGILYSINQIVSAPDLSNQYLWVWLFLFASISPSKTIKQVE